MSSPNFVIQIKLDGSFRDVAADTKSVKLTIGRERVLDAFAAGRCILALNNQDAKYGPLTGGTYGAAQWINAEVRVAVYLNSASQPTPLFRGFCDDVDALYPDSADSVVVVKASDGLSKLARTEINDHTFVEQVGSARFAAVLNLDEVDYPNESSPLDRSIGTSTITMAGATVANIGTMTYLTRLAQSEDGAIYCRHGIPGGAAATAANRGNVLTYKERHAVSTATGLTFGPSSSLSAQPPFHKITTSYGSELLYTRGVYAGSTGNDQIYEENVYGVPSYGIRTIVRRNLLNLNDDDVEKAATNFIALHSQPALRISSLTCKPRAMTDAQAEKVAKLGIWDGITATFTPAGASSAQNRIVRVEGVTHEISPGDWTMKINTSGSGDQVFLIYDSAIDGILGSSKYAP